MTTSTTSKAMLAKASVLAEVADMVGEAKLQKDKASANWDKARAIALKLRRVSFKSAKWQVDVVETGDVTGYDKAKLDAYFEQQKINPARFYSTRPGAKRVLVKPLS